MFKQIKYKFWGIMSLRCNHCPFAGSDWSDYNETGYIGSRCNLHSNNECEGCMTPAIVIFFKYRKYLKQQKKSSEYEELLLKYEDQFHTEPER